MRLKLIHRRVMGCEAPQPSVLFVQAVFYCLLFRAVCTIHATDTRYLVGFLFLCIDNPPELLYIVYASVGNL